MRSASVICLAFLLLAGAVQAQQDGPYTKLTQPPNMNVSYDFASAQIGGFIMMTADDWVCPDGNPIVGIRWWGSYWQVPAMGQYSIYSDWWPNAPSGGISGFAIAVLNNVGPTIDMPFDHPDPNLGNAVVVWTISGNAGENYYGTVVKSTSPSITEDIYEYYADVSWLPFSQVQGTKYWLSIVAMGLDGTALKQWGWHEASAHYGSYAVQSAGISDQMAYWYVPCGGRDMSFELIAVPEPCSLLALASGLIGLAGCLGRSRKRP